MQSRKHSVHCTRVGDQSTTPHRLTRRSLDDVGRNSFTHVQCRGCYSLIFSTAEQLGRSPSSYSCCLVWWKLRADRMGAWKTPVLSGSFAVLPLLCIIRTYYLLMLIAYYLSSSHTYHAADVITAISLTPTTQLQIAKVLLSPTSQIPTGKMASANSNVNSKQQQIPDLVVLFDYNINHHLSRQDRRDKAQAVLEEYQSILNTLHNAGLVAAGKPGNSKTEVMVLISCPLRKLYELVEREKYV